MLKEKTDMDSDQQNPERWSSKRKTQVQKQQYNDKSIHISGADPGF